jgi:ubiquinone/menaquinone biosynthesis C-methylase UbiE
VDQLGDIYSPAFVRDVFDRCSEKYITFSLVSSLGFTERWRRPCVAALPAPVPAASGYDLMAGTGEVWPHLLKRFPDTAQIVAVDISAGMRRRALARLHVHRDRQIAFVEDDVLRSELPSASADFLISAFGLKTFNSAQHERLATLIERVLRPGGVFSLIEASDGKGFWLRPLYLFHLKVVLPLIVRLFLRGAQDFAMIGTYVTNFGDASAFAAMLRAKGLEVEFQRFFFGCATGVRGRKPL